MKYGMEGKTGWPKGLIAFLFVLTAVLGLLPGT